MKDRKFSAEAMIKRLKAPLFGIDLHWTVPLLLSNRCLNIDLILRKGSENCKKIPKKALNQLCEKAVITAKSRLILTVSGVSLVTIAAIILKHRAF